MSAGQKLEMFELGNKLYREYKKNKKLLTPENAILWAYVRGLWATKETWNEAKYFDEYLKFIGKQLEDAAAIDYQEFGEFILESLNNNDSTMTQVLVFLKKLDAIIFTPPPKPMVRDRTPDMLQTYQQYQQKRVASGLNPRNTQANGDA
jgi:hypothetical protein